MVGLVSILAGEILYESIKFVIMLGLLVAAVFIGGALRKKKDAKKARREEECNTEAKRRGNCTRCGSHACGR